MWRFLWRRGVVICLVCPRSFLGTSGSGTGGLNGFTQKLNCRRARLVPVACEGMKVNDARFGKALKFAAGLGDQ